MGRTMGTATRLGLALAVAASFGCYEERAYLCETDGQCNLDGVRGRCQLTGYCSYPDLECGSEYRYESHAGEGLAGQCVEEDAATTTEGG
jgi:hypothetical protein